MGFLQNCLYLLYYKIDPTADLFLCKFCQDPNFHTFDDITLKFDPKVYGMGAKQLSFFRPNNFNSGLYSVSILRDNVLTNIKNFTELLNMYSQIFKIHETKLVSLGYFASHMQSVYIRVFDERAIDTTTLIYINSYIFHVVDWITYPGKNCLVAVRGYYELWSYLDLSYAVFESNLNLIQGFNFRLCGKTFSRFYLHSNSGFFANNIYISNTAYSQGFIQSYVGVPGFWNELDIDSIERDWHKSHIVEPTFNITNESKQGLIFAFVVISQIAIVYFSSNM